MEVVFAPSSPVPVVTTKTYSCLLSDFYSVFKMGVQLVMTCSHLLGAEVGVLGLLLAGVRPVHGVVLLELHGLHLLLDGVHLAGWFCDCAPLLSCKTMRLH